MRDKPPLSLLKSIILPFGARMKNPPSRPVDVAVPRPMYGFHPNSDLLPENRYQGCMDVCLTYPPSLPSRRAEISAPPVHLPGDVPLGKDFLNTDYYLWYGSGFSASSWSCCRACLYVAYDRAERKLHMDITKCDKAIWQAVKKLCVGNQCAVCNDKTTHWEYGVYLCSDMCRMKWRITETATRENMEHVLKLMGFKPESIES